MQEVVEVGRALLLVMLVLLAGCRLEADVGVEVDRDGAGTLSIRLEQDEELARRAADAGVDPFAPVVEAVADDDVWTATRDGTALSLSTSFTSPDALAGRSGAFAADVHAAELRPLAPFALEVTDDRITLRGGAGLVPTAAVTELGFTEADAVTLLEESVDYRIWASMPGDILEVSGGGRVDGRTVTWSVPAGRTLDVAVVARRPPLVPWWAWAVGALTALALLGGMAAVLRRRGA